MRKHVKAFGYKEKEVRVQSGEICQSIRKGTDVSKGDEVLWHGWRGKPRHSKWSWRMRVKVTDVIEIAVTESGFYLSDLRYNHIPLRNRFFHWTSDYADEIAVKDGIEPPTGVELADVLGRFHELPSGHVLPMKMQIIRWTEDTIISYEPWEEQEEVERDEPGLQDST